MRVGDTSDAARVPRARRPHMPGYGLERASTPPGEVFPWSEIEARLAGARCYWIVTTRPDGRPHAAPVWGAWLDGALVFDSGRESRKTKNLQARPDAVVHLDGGENVVILEGRAVPAQDRDLVRRLAEAYREKYAWEIDPDAPPGVVFVFRPSRAISFREELGDTATRWEFDD